jgi:hypothetical protein
MDQAALADGLAFDAFSVEEDGLARPVECRHCADAAV